MAGSLPLFGFEICTFHVFSGQEKKQVVNVPRDPLPRTAFCDGEKVSIWVKPPINGFLKLLPIENGDVIGFDISLALTHRRFQAGKRVV